ncbi:MAG: alpha/beta hydrolase [Firmicutes bacterium]|nr:alpha/beta hydrolase [Bacillota bacterium]
MNKTKQKHQSNFLKATKHISVVLIVCLLFAVLASCLPPAGGGGGGNQNGGGNGKEICQICDKEPCVCEEGQQGIDKTQSVFLNVPYGSHASQKIDIYYGKPLKDMASKPVVLMIHGGNVCGEDKGSYSQLANIMTALPLGNDTIVISMDYRLAEDGFTYKDSLEDISLVMKFIYENRSEYKFKANAVGIVGSSVGGYLAFMYALTLPPNALIKVPAVAGVAMPVDFKKTSGFYAIDESNISFASQLLGINLTAETLNSGEFDEVLMEASLITYVRANSPATLIAYGEDSGVASSTDNLSLHSALITQATNQSKHDYYADYDKEIGILNDWNLFMKIAELALAYFIPVA